MKKTVTNGATYPDSKPRFLARVLYFDLWYFELKDTDAGVDLFLNITINNPYDTWIGKRFGLFRSADSITCVHLPNGEELIHPLTYYHEFETTAKSLDITLENVISIKSNDDNLVKIHWSEPALDFACDVEFARQVPPGPETRMDFGHRRRDTCWWFAYMPSATATGTITRGTEQISIDTREAYSDSLWGSTSSLAWIPWIFIHGNDILVFAWSSGIKRERVALKVYYSGKWKAFERVSFEMESFTTSEKYSLRYPSKIHVSAQSGSTSIDFVTEETGSSFVFDIGMNGMVVPIVRSLNFSSSGRYIEGESSIRFEREDTSFDWWQPLDYFKLL
jgi:hypothetical protein